MLVIRTTKYVIPPHTKQGGARFGMTTKSRLGPSPLGPSSHRLSVWRVAGARGGVVEQLSDHGEDPERTLLYHLNGSNKPSAGKEQSINAVLVKNGAENRFVRYT
ncbi:hypothetical protein THAOC_26100 [Thalassiosira oceanica]|uniref:Uncharacterized protein n=1 Tax=Thalassiosira oceanica TaxID=159749 RepID=K0RME8_THAOC|nr:hypothetical protein THAOC_26100 [Thalassiosira oceanica]|eukprot:EJK54290.1 hypothetical protein THAOC_26100 [Thalassiosira oceanica]